MIVLKGRVLDGNGGAPIEKGAVVLEDDRIRLVCRQSELPDDPTAEVYELEDGTIIATDPSYVPLLLSGYYYTIRPVFSNQF